MQRNELFACQKWKETDPYDEYHQIYRRIPIFIVSKSFWLYNRYDKRRKTIYSYHLSKVK